MSWPLRGQVTHARNESKQMSQYNTQYGTNDRGETHKSGIVSTAAILDKKVNDWR